MIFKKKYLIIFLIIIVICGVFCVINLNHAATSNISVCDLGCDYTTLAGALTDPGLDGDALVDVITMTTDYTFDFNSETAVGVNLVLAVPAGVTISCDAGADIFGDQNEAEIEISTNSDFILQNCSTENTKFSLFGTNVNLLNNTFSSSTESWIILTGVDGYEISGNTGIQRLQLQGADNGLIEDNNIECRFTGCVNVVTAGAPDYNDPPSIDGNICNNVLINNNNITNYATGNVGTWVLVNGGKNIQITNNTISSAVTMDDVYLTLVAVFNAQAEFTGNYIISPEKVPGATQTTSPFNIQVDEYNVEVLYEHNTVYTQGEHSCISLYDGGGKPNIPIDITANYNLCFQESTVAGGYGISLEYVIGSSNVTIIDSFNGFYGYSALINDTTGTITTLNANTVTKNPLLRTENIDTDDDYYPSPFSNYFDVDGTLDIGAYSASRRTTISIAEAGPVDYLSIDAVSVTDIIDGIRSGDTLNVATGVYDPVELDFSLDDLTFSGQGDGTIFDASGVGNAFSIKNITNSDFNDFQVQGSESISTTTYSIDHAQYTDGVNTYDEAVNLGVPANSVLILTAPPVANTCNSSEFYAADDFDITAIASSTTSNWNLGLVNYFAGFARFTVLVPDEYVSSAAELLGCGNPGDIIVEHFLDDVYVLNDGVYTYNASAVSGAGLSVKLGDTDPPAITRTIVTEEFGGLIIDDSSGNSFTNITAVDNDYSLIIKGSANSNTIIDSTLSNSVEGDVFILGTGNNTLEDTFFDRSSALVTGSGEVTVKYSVQAEITDDDDNPLEGVQNDISSDNNLDTVQLITGGSGLSPFSSPLTAYILTSTNIQENSGGYNPYHMDSSLDGYSSNSLEVNLNTPNQTVSLVLPEISSGGSSGSTLNSQINNLVEMGKIQEAEDLRNKFSNFTFNLNLLSPEICQFINLLISLDIIDIGVVQLDCAATDSPVLIKQNFVFTRDMDLGSTGEDVRQLQIFLNNNGFVLAQTGPGSIGNETNYFGSLTKKALARYQDVNYAFILKPANLSRGTGTFAKFTRNFINDFLSR